MADRLATVAGLPLVIWTGEPYAPTGPHIVVGLSGITRRPIDCAVVRTAGTLTAMVRYPLERAREAEVTAAAIEAAFPMTGPMLDLDAGVDVLTSCARNGETDGPWWSVPVTVTFDHFGS